VNRVTQLAPLSRKESSIIGKSINSNDNPRAILNCDSALGECGWKGENNIHHPAGEKQCAQLENRLSSLRIGSVSEPTGKQRQGPPVIPQ
jgi:hypothetical protein